MSSPDHSQPDIASWLESVGLGPYAATFAENEITLEMLRDLTSEDLKELGVSAMGHRKRLLAEIASLAGNASAPAESVPATSAPAESAPAAVPAVHTIVEAKIQTVPSPDPGAFDPHREVKFTVPPPSFTTPALVPPPSAPSLSRSPARTPPTASAPAAPAGGRSATAPSRGFWATLLASKFLFISIVAHLVFGVGATYFIVQRIQAKRKVTFQSGPPVTNPSKRALEHKVSMAQKKKTGGAPPQAKRIATTGLSKLSLPDMPSMPSATTVVPGMAAGMGGAGFGQGMGFGSGMGSGMGGAGGGGGAGISFFGLRTSAKRLAFLLDYSGSMEGAFRKAMERELEKALTKLPPGTQLLLIPWAGPAWRFSETAPEIMSKWKKIDEYDNFEIRAGAKLDPPTWVLSSPTNVENIMKGIRAQVAAPGGTDWRQPFIYVMQANPPPEVIIFMTDAQMLTKNSDRTLNAIDAALKKAPRPPQVNCLWIENGVYHGTLLKALAKKYQGEFREVSADAASKD